MSDNVTALDLNLNRYSMKSDLRPKIGRVAIFNNSTFVDSKYSEKTLTSHKQRIWIGSTYSTLAYSLPNVEAYR